MTAQEKIQKLVTQDFILQHHCNSYRAILSSVGVSDRVEHYNILKKVLAERHIKFDSHYRKNEFSFITQELLNECYSYAAVLKKINCAKSGFAQQRLKQYIEEQHLDISHLLNYNKY